MICAAMNAAKAAAPGSVTALLALVMSVSVWSSTLADAPRYATPKAQAAPGVSAQRVKQAPASPQTARLTRGGQLFQAQGCVSCHGDGGISLANVGVYTDAEIVETLKAPPAGMPVFNLPAADNAALIVYLRHKATKP